MIRPIVAALLIGSISACSLQSQEDFDAKPFEIDQHFPRNYQAVYADVVKGARTCWRPMPQFTSMPQATQLETNLYPELGYGEVYSYASGTVFAPQVLVRVEKQANGARVKIKTGPQWRASEIYSPAVLKWANGDTDCN